MAKARVCFNFGRSFSRSCGGSIFCQFLDRESFRNFQKFPVLIHTESVSLDLWDAMYPVNVFLTWVWHRHRYLSYPITRYINMETKLTYFDVKPDFLVHPQHLKLTEGRNVDSTSNYGQCCTPRPPCTVIYTVFESI